MTGYWVVLYLLACGELLVRLNTGVATAQQTYKCDFEEGICSWLKNHNNDQWGNNWILGKGKLNKADTGPSFDHTLGNENGTYLFVNLTATGTEDVKLETVTLKSRYCLRFFYHMYGPEVPTFMVNLIYNNNDVYRYFARSKTQGDRWQEAVISLNPLNNIIDNGYKAVFWISNSQYTKAKGDVALDDIELTPGMCKANKNIAESLCTFDNYKCGYTEDNSVSKWTWRTYDNKASGFPLQPATDHTLGTDYGGYWVNGINPTGFSATFGPLLSNTVLSSPVYYTPTNPLNCLHFFFWVDGNKSHWYWGEVEEAYVQVHLNFPDSSRGRQWLVTKAKNISSHREWMYVEAGAIITERFQIQFTSMLKGKIAASVAIDDVQLFAGNCPEAGSCDFEDGKCSWLDGNDQYNWVRKTGKSNTNGEIGPYLDTTKDSPDGGYVVFSTIGKNPGAQASLESEYLSAEGDALCVSFYYQMSGTDLGSLKVLRKESNITEATLWFLSDDQGALWKKGMVEMKPSLIVNQVVFRGTIGKGENGFMALDDIRIRKGEKCDLAPPVADPRYENTCQSNSDCSNGMSCRIEEDIGFCQCVDGLSGDKCQIIDDCKTGKFKKCNDDIGGECKFLNETSVCECKDGKEFDILLGVCRGTCKEDYDCSNFMSCKVEENIGHCQCAPGLSGDKCELIDDCITGKFKMCNDDIGGECKFLNGKSVCQCKDRKEFDTTLEVCRETCVQDSDCSNGMNCRVEEGIGFCQCIDGLSGDKCDTIDGCYIGKFKNCYETGGQCKFLMDKPVCDCGPGKGFDTTVEACRETCDPENNICWNEALCEAKNGYNFCTCATGMTGDLCQYLTACERGGTYENCTREGGTCKFIGGQATCLCEIDKQFDIKRGQCRSTCDLNTKKCLNGAVCEDHGGQNFCTCAEGLTGDLCEVITDCQKGEKYEKCSGGGGTCKFSNDDGKAVCDCVDGKHFDSEMGLCRNQCFSNPCKNDGVCTVINSTDYLCECKQPFSGDHCERHPCHSNPCLNDGTCIAVENNYGCVCDDPFYGRLCENEIDTTEAISDSTINDRITSGPVTTNEIECYCGENSVSCRLNWLGEKLCFCKKGYDQRGGTEICSRTCQSNADCRNDGICDRDGLGYFCVCPGTFIGDRCEVDVCNYVRFECRSRGAECVRQGTIGVCECPRGKKMSPNNYCEDVCTYETCVYGTCELTGYDFSQYVCNCYEGYYGIHCENALEYTPAISLIVILASGILLFSITSIVAGCWVKRLRKKFSENTKQTGQP